MFDYEGLSSRVIATRNGPYLLDQDGIGNDDFGFQTTGDRFISTFTYGPLGVVARTDERGDSDPLNNRDHYYLPDAMGNQVGLYADQDGDPLTERVAFFNPFDAFGVPLDKSIFGSGSLKRRLVPLSTGADNMWHYSRTVH